MWPSNSRIENTDGAHTHGGGLHTPNTNHNAITSSLDCTASDLPVAHVTSQPHSRSRTHTSPRHITQLSRAPHVAAYHFWNYEHAGVSCASIHHAICHPNSGAIYHPKCRVSTKGSVTTWSFVFASTIRKSTTIKSRSRLVISVFTPSRTLLRNMW